MVEALFMMGGLGLLVGVGLAAASKVFYVYVDPVIEAVEGALPGANCGGCGFPGCSANAKAIVAGKSSPSSCVAAGEDTAQAIAAILGVSVEAKEPDIARPGCYFGLKDAEVKYLYNGLSDCRAAVLLSGGMKVCSVGCLGLGSCAKACPFGAITMGPEGLPVVDEKRCTGCGTCERVCPKHIITLSSVTRRILREYTTDECTTPCQRNCPAGINIREYIRQISMGDYHQAVQVIKERNPFPTAIGRICPRPCETECRRKYVDEPLAINYLKRFASDFEKESGKRVLPYKAPATGKKIAVAGGGVEGLSAAYFSARLGHEVALFEATSKLGGLLRSAIARYRLSHDILDWDIQGILDLGVTAHTGKSLGKDFTVDSLLEQGFDAVLLASGGWDSRLTRGADKSEAPVPGTSLLIDFLKASSEDRKKWASESPIVIAGGEKLALIAARQCREFKQNVTVLFRESREQNPVESAEIEAIEKEGVQVVFGAAITRLFGEKNSLSDLEYMASGVKTVIAARKLLIASGRFPELLFTKVKAEAAEEGAEAPVQGPIRWEARLPYKQPAYKDQVGLFAQGDVLSDYSAAIKAIGAGRRAAVSVHQVMYDIPSELPENVLTPDSALQDVDHLENVKALPRKIMPLCDAKELAGCGELEKGFSEAAAQAEASRCLQCGLICYEHPEGMIAEKKEALAA